MESLLLSEFRDLRNEEPTDDHTIQEVQALRTRTLNALGATPYGQIRAAFNFNVANARLNFVAASPIRDAEIRVEADTILLVPGAQAPVPAVRITDAGVTYILTPAGALSRHLDRHEACGHCLD